MTSRYKASGIHNNCLDDGSGNALTGVPSFSHMVNDEDLDRNGSTTNHAMSMSMSMSVEEDQFSLSINEDSRKEHDKFQGFILEEGTAKVNGDDDGKRSKSVFSDASTSSSHLNLLIKDKNSKIHKRKIVSNEENEDVELNENGRLGSVKEEQQMNSSKSLNSDGGNNEFEMLFEKATKDRDRGDGEKDILNK